MAIQYYAIYSPAHGSQVKNLLKDDYGVVITRESGEEMLAESENYAITDVQIVKDVLFDSDDKEIK